MSKQKKNTLGYMKVSERHHQRLVEKRRSQTYRPRPYRRSTDLLSLNSWKALGCPLPAEDSPDSPRALDHDFNSEANCSLHNSSAYYKTVQECATLQPGAGGNTVNPITKSLITGSSVHDYNFYYFIPKVCFVTAHVRI